MQIIEIKTIFPTKIEREKNQHGFLKRSTNKLHLSDIYKDLNEEIHNVKKSDNKLYAEVGLLFEEILKLAFGDNLGVRIGEVELDGILGSPDGVNVKDWYLEEYKCTWKSTKTTPAMVWVWMVQVKGYLKMLGMKKVLFRVLYIVGDYKGSGPVYKEFEIVFTQDEIDQNWKMVVNHAKRKGWL